MSIHEPGHLPSFLRVPPAGCPARPIGPVAPHANRTLGVFCVAEPEPFESPSSDMQPMTLYVCTTCRDAAHVVGQGAPCAGARLYANIAAAPADPLIHIVPVECLSVCKRTCAVGFAAPGKWTYVYGDLPAETATETILAGARLYAQAPDGLIPWKLRPEALKKGVIARVPPAVAT